MFYAAAFRQNCSSESEELQFSSLLGLDGFTLMFHTTTLICTVPLVTSQSCVTLWKGIRIAGAYWLGRVDSIAGETLQVFPRPLVY